MADETSKENNPNGLATPKVVEGAEKGIEQLNAYWTPEKLLAATPLMPELDPNDDAQPLFEGVWTRTKDEVQRQATQPDSKDNAVTLSQPTCPAAGPNTERVPNRNQMPYSAVGKLFMTFNGSDFVGSAWTIKDSGVITAAHCLYDHQRGGYADNVMFVPQYHKGAEPVGQWAAIEMVALKGWTDNGPNKFVYDLAAFRTNRPIAPVTGSLGWLAHANPNQGCGTGIGYPSRNPFDGKEMWSSTGQNLGGHDIVQFYNNMTPGCSGGPVEIWKDGTPLANGVNSHRYGDPNKMYSPYFGDGIVNLYNWLT